MRGSPSRADSPEANVQGINGRASSRDTSPQEPPQLLLDGLALSAEEQTSSAPRNNAAEEEAEAGDDAAERRRKLDALRAQLQRSELNRSPSISHHRIGDDNDNNTATRQAAGATDTHDQSPTTADTSPDALKSSQRSRRRVQWVGLSADDEFRKRSDHASLSIVYNSDQPHALRIGEQHKRAGSRPSSSERGSTHNAGHISVSMYVRYVAGATLSLSFSVATDLLTSTTTTYDGLLAETLTVLRYIPHPLDAISLSAAPRPRRMKKASPFGPPSTACPTVFKHQVSTHRMSRAQLLLRNCLTFLLASEMDYLCLHRPSVEGPSLAKLPS